MNAASNLHTSIYLKLAGNNKFMIEPGMRMADMSKEKDSKTAHYEFGGQGRVRVSFDYDEDGLHFVDYAIDMPFDELFDGEKAEVGKVTGNARLNTPDGERIGKYHAFEYDPTVEEGALMGRLGANREDLTEYANSQALRDLDDAAKLLR
jgi:hypothetical protein